MPPEIRTYRHGGPEYVRALVLRRAELRTPLGLTYSTEDLAQEADETHFGAFLPDGQVIGSLSLRSSTPGVIKMRQVVVDPGWRRHGVGRMLVIAAENYCREQGIRRIELNARTAVLSFYTTLGYEATGAEFTEVTLPHICMFKLLEGTPDPQAGTMP
jgi:N-acetylglutamate synthase-like GNAT family acetyltransferase